jgi:hypothetical protein
MVATQNLAAAEVVAVLTERRLHGAAAHLFSVLEEAEVGVDNKIPSPLNIYTVQMVVHGVRILMVPRIMVHLLKVRQVRLEQVELCMGVAMEAEAEREEMDKRQVMVVLAEPLAVGAAVEAEATRPLAV